MEEEKESTTYFSEICIPLKNYQNLKKCILWEGAGSVHVHMLMLPHHIPKHTKICIYTCTCTNTDTHVLDWTSNLLFSL